MTRLLTYGFEAGVAPGFVLAGASVSSAQKRTGTYSLLFSNGYTTVSLPALKSEIYFRAGFRMTSIWGIGLMLGFMDTVPALHFFLYLTAANKLAIMNQSHHGSQLALGTATINFNQWYCIEGYIKIADAPNGRCWIKVDGVTDIDFTGDTLYAAGAGVGAFRFAAEQQDGNYSVGYLDDFAVNDTAGAVNNSWIGRGGIIPLFPTGAGTYTDLHASEGDPFECINEVPASDADYVQDAVVNQKSVYALTNLVPAAGNVACINLIMRAVASLSGSRNIARLLRSNSVDGQGADVGIDVSPKTVIETIETDPGTPGGTGAWTVDAVNALEAGMVVR